MNERLLNFPIAEIELVLLKELLHGTLLVYEKNLDLSRDGNSPYGHYKRLHERLESIFQKEIRPHGPFWHEC